MQALSHSLPLGEAVLVKGFGSEALEPAFVPLRDSVPNFETARRLHLAHTVQNKCGESNTANQRTNMKLEISVCRKPTAVRSAYTLVEIMIVVSLIGLLLAIAVPFFVKSRESAQFNSIISNLRIIENAKDQWALQNQKGTGDTTDWPLLSDYIKGGTVKPATSETYTISPMGTSAYATATVRLGTYAPSDPITAQ